MGDQKWNKNALGYGEKRKALSQDQWNKNALNYDLNEKINKNTPINKTKKHSKIEFSSFSF